MRIPRRVLSPVLSLASALSLALMVGLAGCKLIDQTTFVPDPEPPAPGQIAATAAMDQRVALLVIKYETPDPPYQELLRYAVLSADRRNPAIEYDVVAVIPGPATAPLGPAAETARLDAARIMRAMMALDVTESRIHLGASNDAAATVPEVRIYVR